VKRRVAIVTPWFGPDAVGGAESLARELATRLAQIDDVTILTTTSRAFLSQWDENYYPPGPDRSEAFAVIRFAVEPRDRQLFDAVNAELLATPPERRKELLTRASATNPFIEESINSRPLEEHLRGSRSRYDAVLFLPYLYGVVVRGIEAYPGTSHLLPCLHDEPYAYIPRIESAIHRAGSLLFNSEGEAELALRLYGPGILHKSAVVGSGIPPAPEEDVAPVLDGQFLLYLGRRDSTKNVDFLVDAYRRYQSERNGKGKLNLVLAGPGNASYGDAANSVYDLGFVDEAQKVALLRRARALLQPSVNESYSRVLMEAWREGTPVAAHSKCLATATAVQTSGGGWLAEAGPEWTDLMLNIEEVPEGELAQIAQRGAVYASENADWSRVTERIRARVYCQPQEAEVCGKRRIDQVVQTLEYGDAISDYALHIQDALRSRGIESTIFAEGIGPRVEDRAVTFSPEALDGAELVLYHHSISCEAGRAVAHSTSPKVMIYHNVTPARFFEPFHPAYAELLQTGYEQTRDLTAKFDRYVADSQFNAEELIELGAPKVTVVPLAVDFRRFDVLPDERVLTRPNGGARWLFVGRVAPNKGIRSLLEAFEAYLAVDSQSTLTIVGRYDPAETYYRSLIDLWDELGLGGNVRFAGAVDNEALCAYYRSSDVYVSLSEHEGFCVPLVEAMYFDIPIVARDSSAVPGTLGEGGLLVGEGMGAIDIAALVWLLRTDATLCERVLAGQRRQRRHYSPEAGNRRIETLVEELVR
jgi:glycosyltransferase involved in cell wall biosynthesis